jgi:hypothetical protein
VLYPLGREAATGAESVEQLINAVLDFTGGRGNLDMRNRAIIHLNAAADALSLCGIYLSLVQEQETTGFSTGQESIPLPEDWLAPYGTPHFKDAEGKITQLLSWEPWNQFTALRSNRSSDSYSTPQILSIRSPHRDNLIYLYPPISASYAAYTLTVPYLGRIQQVTEADQLYYTPGIRRALVEGAKYFSMQYLHPEEPGIWREYQRAFNSICEQLTQESAMHESEGGNQGFYFELGDHLTSPNPSLPNSYIKI